MTETPKSFLLGDICSLIYDIQLSGVETERSTARLVVYMIGLPSDPDLITDDLMDAIAQIKPLLLKVITGPVYLQMMDQYPESLTVRAMLNGLAAAKNDLEQPVEAILAALERKRIDLTTEIQLYPLKPEAQQQVQMMIRMKREELERRQPLLKRMVSALRA